MDEREAIIVDLNIPIDAIMSWIHKVGGIDRTNLILYTYLLSFMSKEVLILEYAPDCDSSMMVLGCGELN